MRVNRAGSRRIAGAVAALALAVGASVANAAETVRLAITDISGLEQLQAEFGAFKNVLSEATGLELDFFAVNSRTAAVEALDSGKVDFVLTGPAEYIVMRERTGAFPVVGFSRPDYFAAIVVMADSGYRLPADIKGETVAFGDIGSTSNHLAPAQALADYGVDPMRDIEATHVSHNVAWEALKRGDVAAVGMNHGKFLTIREAETELEPGAFRVIARGPDLPNDVLVAGPHVDAAIVEAVRAAFVSHAEPLIEAILVGEDNQKYRGMTFLDDMKDADYDYVRAMYATIGRPEYAELVGN